MRRIARARRSAIEKGSALARSASLPTGVAIGLLLAGAWLSQVSTLNHDAGWLLVGARRLLAGARLYVDGFVDATPPGILYWMAPAVLASKLAGLPVTRVYAAWWWLWGVASLGLCDRLLRAQLGPAHSLARPWAVALLAFVFFIWPAA